MISGFALIDKDPDWTSHDVVARLRRLYGQRRVGHAGTLDPMATGVLIVGLGHATRLLRFVQAEHKTYEATIRLGQATVTDDAQGDVTADPGWEWDPAGLSTAVTALTGQIQQVPSSVSAIKVDGVRSYARVRSGQDVELAARPVTISRFDVVGQPRMEGHLVDIDVVVQCSSGTYIRALARDLGASLGSAGHLTALRRTAIGHVDVAQCTVLGSEAPAVTPAEEVIGRILPTLSLDRAELHALGDGRQLQIDATDGTYLVVDSDRWRSVVSVNSGRTRIEVNAPS